MRRHDASEYIVLTSVSKVLNYHHSLDGEPTERRDVLHVHAFDTLAVLRSNRLALLTDLASAAAIAPSAVLAS